MSSLQPVLKLSSFRFRNEPEYQIKFFLYKFVFLIYMLRTHRHANGQTKWAATSQQPCRYRQYA